MCVWSTRFHLQQSVSIGSGKNSVRERQGQGLCVTSCVMISGTLVLATTGRDILFYDTVSFSCLHKFQSKLVSFNPHPTFNTVLFSTELLFVPLCLAYGVEDEKDVNHCYSFIVVH